MTQPISFVKNGICWLKMTYGWTQAPKCRCRRFDTFIESFRFQRYDGYHWAYFYSFRNGIFMVLYMDNMVVSSTNEVGIENLKARLVKELGMKDERATIGILQMKIFRD